MAALTVRTGSRSAGLDNTSLEAAGAGGDTFPAGKDMWLRVKNGNAAACTVTVDPGDGTGPSGTTLADITLAPATGATTGDRTYGPFPAYPFAQADGLVHVTYSVTATVTVAALKFPEG